MLIIVQKGEREKYTNQWATDEVKDNRALCASSEDGWNEGEAGGYPPCIFLHPLRHEKQSDTTSIPAMDNIFCFIRRTRPDFCLWTTGSIRTVVGSNKSSWPHDYTSNVNVLIHRSIHFVQPVIHQYSVVLTVLGTRKVGAAWQIVDFCHWEVKKTSGCKTLPHVFRRP